MFGTVNIQKAYLTGIDTSDATATSNDILSGKTAYVYGIKIIGTMPDNGSVNHTLSSGEIYEIPTGYHDGSGKVIGI